MQKLINVDCRDNPVTAKRVYADFVRSQVSHQISQQKQKQLDVTPIALPKI